MLKKKKRTKKLDPKLKDAVTAAYKLGLMDGEKRALRIHNIRAIVKRAVDIEIAK